MEQKKRGLFGETAVSRADGGTRTFIEKINENTIRKRKTDQESGKSSQLRWQKNIDVLEVSSDVLQQNSVSRVFLCIFG